MFVFYSLSYAGCVNRGKNKNFKYANIKQEDEEVKGKKQHEWELLYVTDNNFPPQQLSLRLKLYRILKRVAIYYINFHYVAR